MGDSLDKKALSAVRLRFALCHMLNALIAAAIVYFANGYLTYHPQSSVAFGTLALVVILVVWFLIRIERHGLRLLEFSKKLAARKPGSIYELGYLTLKQKAQTKIYNRQKSGDELKRRIEGLRGDNDGGPA